MLIAAIEFRRMSCDIAALPSFMKSRLWSNPFFHIFLCAVFATTAEVLLKMGAKETAHLPSILPWLGLSGLTSKWIWLSILCTLVSLGAWMQAISILPLSVAFTLSNVVHVLIPLSCWAFLGEAINPIRWLGISLVVIGLLLIAKPFANLDERI